MNDFNQYFQEKYDEYTQLLKKRYEEEVVNQEGPKNDLRNAFIKAINFEKDTILESREPFDKNAAAVKTLPNRFKDGLIERFDIIWMNFPKERINGFVKFDIPKLKEVHQGSYEGGNKEDYLFDPEFMYKSTDKEIVEMIAKYKAYSDFGIPDNNIIRDLEFSEFTEKLEEKEKNKGEQGTTAQIVATIMLLNKRYEFIKAQDNVRFIEFIHFLSGKDKKNISTFVGRYRNYDGDIQETNEQNLKDYQKVKKIFERLEKQLNVKDVNKKIDKYSQRLRKVE